MNVSNREISHSVVDLEQVQGFQFKAVFSDGMPELYIDEPQPTGTGTGPNPEQLLASSAGYCLAASLSFALGKFKQETGGMKVHVRSIPGRNEESRLRIFGIHVTITLGKPEAAYAHLDRALMEFEDFCVIAESIRSAIPIRVIVKDSECKTLKESD